jgi:hypothetical protein
MTVARATADWLAVREPPDAKARSAELVEQLRGLLTDDSPLIVHDLGCGTGSTRRWLGPKLKGSQHWIEHDRDRDLIEQPRTPGMTSLDGTAVTVEVRCSDITRLSESEIAGASLITASALLDMLTADELIRFASSCAAAGCPCLITLSVKGRVDLRPHDPLDERLQRSFNDHQRRTTPEGTLLGPDAAPMARHQLEQAGMTVSSRPSPWLLGKSDGLALAEWFEGWLGAACEQDPTLGQLAEPYADRRRAQLAEGLLSARIHHTDLLAWHP